VEGVVGGGVDVEGGDAGGGFVLLVGRVVGVLGRRGEGEDEEQQGRQEAIHGI
jgi:hypothetical protein